MGGHFCCFHVLAIVLAKWLQLCPTLCDPIDGSPLGSSVPGILQARILEWVAISLSNAWKWKVKVKCCFILWCMSVLDYCFLWVYRIYGNLLEVLDSGYRIQDEIRMKNNMNSGACVCGWLYLSIDISSYTILISIFFSCKFIEHYTQFLYWIKDRKSMFLVYIRFSNTSFK